MIANLPTDDGMAASFYLAALQAAAAMGRALGDDVAIYQELFEKGAARVNAELFNVTTAKRAILSTNTNGATGTRARDSVVQFTTGAKWSAL